MARLALLSIGRGVFTLAANFSQLELLHFRDSTYGASSCELLQVRRLDTQVARICRKYRSSCE